MQPLVTLMTQYNLSFPYPNPMLQSEVEREREMEILMAGSSENGDLNENYRRISTEKRKKGLSYWILVAINYISLLLGSVSASLLSRFYFLHGGSNRWVSTWVQSAGFPILLIPIYLSSFLGYSQKPFSNFSPKLLFSCAALGFMMGLNNFFYSWGISYLSVSTSSLLLSCQLAFNLLLCVLLVRQKLNFSNVNCVVLLTISSVLLALGSSHDRPEGVNKAQYFLGFLSILGAALLFALYLPLLEIIYTKLECEFSYGVVMEMQFLMEFTATLFCIVGMVIDGSFEKMKRESEISFNLGVVRYWITLIFSVICWQFCFMGTTGIVFLTSSLMCGICMTALLPVGVISAVVVFGDNFGGEKIISTVLCVWGFSSYLYGEHTKEKEKKQEREMEMEMKMVERENRDSEVQRV